MYEKIFQIEKNNFSDSCIINDDNSFNSLINNNKCISHNLNFYPFCIDCKINLYLFYMKDSNKHDSQVIHNYSDLIPSLYKRDNLKNKLLEKSNHIEILIEKIDNWVREIIKKTEELKQNLKDEISLFSKIVNNFNYYY